MTTTQINEQERDTDRLIAYMSQMVRERSERISHTRECVGCIECWSPEIAEEEAMRFGI